MTQADTCSSRAVQWRRRGALCVSVLLLGMLVAAVAQTHAPAGQPSKVEQGAANGLPLARGLLDRHLDAIGGREALARHTSTHMRGTLSMPAAGISGNLEIFAARPNKTLLRVSLDGVGEVVEAFDGVNGWSVSPLTGPMLLEGKQLEEKRFDAEYDGELRHEARYMSMRTVERTEFEGRPCYKVVLVRTIGGEDVEFYDVETGLKAGGIVTRETPMGPMTGTTVESGYQRFGALLQPTTVRSQMGGIQQVISVTSIEYDTVAPAVFEMPSEIKALLK